jgi:D-3-phosphoglycerate dehydrogenase
MFRVLLTDNIADEALAVFDQYDAVEGVRVGTLPPDELKSTIADFEGIVVRSPTRLTADIIEAAVKLRYIGRAGVGVDNIDIEAATARGIVVMNSPGGNTVSTAEHTIALLLALARRIPHAHISVTGGEWNRAAFKGVELYGKTVGVVGLGRVGREVARRLAAFGMKLLAFDPYLDGTAAAALGAELVDLDELLAGSDVVTVHVPLTGETRELICREQIQAMRDGALLINCARGGVVSEEALLEALDSGKLAGAALDVYESEPPGDHPLFGHPRCVFTPHLGAATREAQVRVATHAAEAVAEALTAGTLRNAVNPPENA